MERPFPGPPGSSLAWETLLTEERPLILVTCDDGVHSPGLQAAVRAVPDLGDVSVPAPREPHTEAQACLS